MCWLFLRYMEETSSEPFFLIYHLAVGDRFLSKVKKKKKHLSNTHTKKEETGLPMPIAEEESFQKGLD